MLPRITQRALMSGAGSFHSVLCLTAAASSITGMYVSSCPRRASESGRPLAVCSCRQGPSNVMTMARIMANYPPKEKGSCWRHLLGLRLAVAQHVARDLALLCGALGQLLQRADQGHLHRARRPLRAATVPGRARARLASAAKTAGSCAGESRAVAVARRPYAWGPGGSAARRAA